MVELKRYKCHKVVHAQPMNRGDYNKYRGWQIPADENPDDNGYLVVYGLGTDDEYESWSPKKQFDEGYTEIGEGPKVKVQTEYQELSLKMGQLWRVLRGDKPYDGNVILRGSARPKDSPIPQHQWNLLTHQYEAMKAYADILEERLRNWE